MFSAALVGLCWLDWHAEPPGIVLLPLALALALLGASELVEMFRKRGYEPVSWVVYGGTLTTVLAAAAPGFLPSLDEYRAVGQLGWLAFGIFIGLILAVLGEMLRYPAGNGLTVNLTLGLFAVVYAGGLTGVLVLLRILDDGRVGMVALLSLVATVKMSDIGQYTAGRLFGRHKLAPKISPGKTWEGVAGGVLFAMIGAWFVLEWCGPRLVGVIGTAGPMLGGSLVRTAGYAMLLVVAGIVGDLAESLLKRDAGVKDSSTWLPGFGGVLDLLDSVLMAAPVAYLLWATGWVVL